jgi:hypothetical protein
MDERHRSDLPDDWNEDEKLAGDYLAGWLEKINGRLIHKYFKPGSKEEKAAQAALSRCLWDWHNPSRPLPAGIRTRLAALFDPTNKAEDRKLKLEYRGHPKKTRAWIRVEITEFVQAEHAKGRTNEIAFENAAKHFKIPEGTVKAAYYGLRKDYKDSR